jgi:Sulfatase
LHKGQAEIWLQRGLLALGGATAIFLSQFYPLMTPSGKIYYHSMGPLRTVALAYLVDLGLMFLLLLALMEGMRRTRHWGLWRLVLAVLLPWLCMVLYPELVVAVLFAVVSRTHELITLLIRIQHWLFLLLLLVWTASLLLLRKFASRGYRRVIAGGKVLAMGLGIFGLLAAYRLVEAAVWQPAPAVAAAWHERSAGAMEAHPRVVWVVFDELSYSAVYEHKATDMEFENFDRLAQQSYVYTNARPVSYWTEDALPSLIAGKAIEKLKYHPDGRLRVFNKQEGWSNFDPGATAFGQAEKAGWNTGIVGWYNPYCSLMSGQLQGCFWVFRTNACGPALASNTVWQNVKETWRFSEVRLNQRIREEHAVDRRELIDRSDSMMADDRYDFVFVHLPIPHPPNVYDRRSGRWVTGPGLSYNDSLALADKVLGQFVTTLQQSPRWAKTTVVVQGDHSWRVGEWRGHPEWTDEDERLSNGGKFDDRPMLIVHAAGQTDGVKVGEAVPLLKAHDIVVSAIENGRPVDLP